MCCVLQIDDYRLQHFKRGNLVDRLNLVGIEHSVEGILLNLLRKGSNAHDPALHDFKLLDRPPLSIHVGKFPRIARRTAPAECFKVECVPDVVSKDFDLLCQAGIERWGNRLQFRMPGTVIALFGTYTGFACSLGRWSFSIVLRTAPGGSAHFGRVGRLSGWPYSLRSTHILGKS